MWVQERIADKLKREEHERLLALAKTRPLAMQSDEDKDHLPAVEVVELNQEQVAEAYQRFAEVRGGPPAPHEELTMEQLTSINAIFKVSGPPYVEFSVWGPL